MKWPLMLRAAHQKALKLREDQVVALSKLLYPQGVPEEFQLLLGIRVPASAAAAPAEPEPEKELTPIEQAAEERAEERRRDKERLTSISRTRPSQMGSTVAAIRNREIQRRADAARPVHKATQVFAQARAEALKNA